MARVPVLLVMHADLADAMVRAAKAMYGDVDGVEVLSNAGCSRETLETKIHGLFDGWKDGGIEGNPVLRPCDNQSAAQGAQTALVCAVDDNRIAWQEISAGI